MLARAVVVLSLVAASVTVMASPAAAFPSGVGWDATYSFYATNAMNYQLDIPGARLYGSAVWNARAPQGYETLVMNVQLTAAGACANGSVTDDGSPVSEITIANASECSVGTVTVTVAAVPKGDWTFELCRALAACNQISLYLAPDGLPIASGTTDSWHYTSANQLSYTMILGPASFNGTVTDSRGGRSEVGTLSNNAGNTCALADTFGTQSWEVCNVGSIPFSHTINSAYPAQFELGYTDLITEHLLGLVIAHP